MKGSRLALLCCFAALLPLAGRADEVFLKSGGRLSGRIVSRTATTIEVDVGAGKISVPVASVVRIEEGQSPLQQYEERAGRLSAGDVDGWLALGQWASDHALGTQARAAYQRALRAAPDDPRANQALGNAEIDGRWVSQDEAYKARGYVQFEGDWITPAERDAILRERAADDQKEQALRQAQADARDAEIRAQEAEARARDAEAAQTGDGGIPLSYGWALAPSIGRRDRSSRNPSPVPSAGRAQGGAEGDAMRARLLLAAATILASSSVQAQTVDEIVARYVAARGGREALAAIRTLRMTGRMSAGPGREAIVRREIARPGRIRTEFEFQGTTGVYVWDGFTGSRVSPLDGSLEAEPLSEEAAALSAEQADIDGPLVDWKVKGHKVDLVGATTLPGGAAHELNVSLKTGGARRLWIDDATGLLVKSASTRTVRGHDLQIETTYGDYRTTDDVAFARSIETGAAGRPSRLRIVVEAVETNPALDDARFRMTR